MGLFKSLKGKGPDYIGGDQAGTSNNYEQFQDTGEKHRLFGHSSPKDGYEQPPGPPPRRQSTQYEAPPSAPPRTNRTEYDPPAGPPPDYSTSSSNQASYHDWTAIPDNSLLPPPPTVRHEESKNNSKPNDANRAHQYCDENPLFAPSNPHPILYKNVQAGDIKLVKAREYTGELTETRNGRWRARSLSTRDTVLLTGLPLYFPIEDSPLVTQVAKIIYFEVKVIRLGGGRRQSEESGIAVGYCAQPYPTWRLPGHERGSLGVHGDDGRRFINDSYGGMDFTSAFSEGETVGIGITFSPGRGDGAANVEVFFTRDGTRDGGWNLFEQKDEASGDIDGLEGRWDLYGAIGVFGNVEFEASFSREGWLHQPRE